MAYKKNSKRTGRSSRKRPVVSGKQRLLTIAVVAVIGLVVVYMVRAALLQNRVDHTELPEASSLLYVKTNPDVKETLLSYPAMTISFNEDTHQPNWVAWELLASETDGAEPRLSFSTDPNVKGCATPDDYKYSGYDRGHMAPAGDMKWSADAMAQSFVMTNICPQAQDLNRGAWKKLEEKCRQKALADSALIIVCGPIFDGEPAMRIGVNSVAVPRRFFKVILSPYADPPTAIGFIMPNAYVPGGMQAVAVPVDSVEAVTGHDFFSALPDELEDALESRANFNSWSHLKKKK